MHRKSESPPLEEWGVYTPGRKFRTVPREVAIPWGLRGEAVYKTTSKRLWRSELGCENKVRRRVKRQSRKLFGNDYWRSLRWLSVGAETNRQVGHWPLQTLEITESPGVLSSVWELRVLTGQLRKVQVENWVHAQWQARDVNASRNLVLWVSPVRSEPRKE